LDDGEGLDEEGTAIVGGVKEDEERLRCVGEEADLRIELVSC
jgi:hypothetical protein